MHPFQVSTSLRYDKSLEALNSLGVDIPGWNFNRQSALYMLDFHRDRMLRAAAYWQWTLVTVLLSKESYLDSLSQQIGEFVGTDGITPQSLRILLDRDGNTIFQKAVVPKQDMENLFPLRLPPPGAVFSQGDPSGNIVLEILIDRVGSQRSAFTHYKTSHRALYNDARARAGISPSDKKEVLIINDETRCISEGSLTTPYFWRDGGWVTPPVAQTFNMRGGCGGQDGTTRRWALQRRIATEQAIEADSLVDGETCWFSNGVHGFRAGKIVL